MGIINGSDFEISGISRANSIKYYVIVFTISLVDTPILSFIQGIKSLPCNFLNACVRMS
jgi:hypothetical protein